MKYNYEILYNETGIGLKLSAYSIYEPLRILKRHPTTMIQTANWKSIESIHAFKQEAFTVDVICLWVETVNKLRFDLTESMTGWKELVDVLPKYLPKCKSFDEWFSEVAFPAFETNLTQIYHREL